MADRNTARKDGAAIGLKLAAGTKIDAGNLVAVNADGFAVPASATASLVVMGVAQQSVDNTAGADGDAVVEIYRKQVFCLSNVGAPRGVTQAQVGREVYVVDAVTVDAGGGPVQILAGICLGVEPDGVWVEIK